VIALLDTHTFLWAAITPEKLSGKVRDLIEDQENEIHLSTVTFWEISLKFALGKLELVGVTPEDLVDVAARMSLLISSPTPEEAAAFHRLPRFAHKDPFDRMLIWQCVRRDWTLITRDRALDEYRAVGLKSVW
jgi:PIN domain nuclease of toxin-antitoxin system